MRNIGLPLPMHVVARGAAKSSDTSTRLCRFRRVVWIRGDLGPRNNGRHEKGVRSLSRAESGARAQSGPVSRRLSRRSTGFLGSHAHGGSGMAGGKRHCVDRVVMWDKSVALQHLVGKGFKVD